MPAKKKTVTRKPRIITKTVTRLRKMAAEIEWMFKAARERETSLGKRYEVEENRFSNRLSRWADELDAYDARETRPDPSKRRRAKAK